MERYFDLDTREKVITKDLDHCSLDCPYLIELRDRDMETGEFIDPFFQCLLFNKEKMDADTGGLVRVGVCKVIRIGE